MKFIGEHLLPGQMGHFLVILSMVASAIATVGFYKSFKVADPVQQQSWKRLARMAFAVETAAVMGVFILLYYIISHNLFEYKYAWQHSSKSLQVEYMLSCFWEGQEGSFMLWGFWHCVLGWVLIARTGSKWEGPVMTVVSFAQFCLATMILGIYFFGFKVGSNPFVLLRNELEAPIFSQPDYLKFVKDGNGLNALLQNYWMVIHPPVLFLGFASTIVPFAFAMAGLMKKEHEGWAEKALPWASFSGAALGLGIMMGAAWAYESLTFGGYWAWDPVENASLVPWLVLIAGLHTNLIYKSSGYSLRSTYLLYMLTFVLVLYSTFLTRSGILGDTSVHAFTDLGMNFQLLAFIGVFMLPALWMYFRQFKSIPSIQQEENVYSREFWMFIGSLVLFFSSMVVIGKTSLPVINKIFGSKIAPPADQEFSQNQIQVWVAVILGILTAITQYFKYKDTPKPFFYKKIMWPTAIALTISLVLSFAMGIEYEKHGAGFWLALHIAMFGAVYAIVANAGYIWIGMKGKLKVASASVAHVGFGLVLLGILISASNRKVLSINTTGISPLKATDKESAYENTTLIKGVETDMGRYMVTYVRDTLNYRDHKRYFEISFKAKDKSSSFKLYPDVIENNKGQEGLTPNPSAKHYLNRDIFAYLTFLSDPTKQQDDTTSFRHKMVIAGDTNYYSKGIWKVERLLINPKAERFAAYANDTLMAAEITVTTRDGRMYKAMPAFRLQGNQLIPLPDTVMSQSLIFALIQPGNFEKKEVEIGVKETTSVLEFVTMKVYEFPWINILWIGVLVTVAGFLMSIWQRVKKLQRTGTP